MKIDGMLVQMLHFSDGILVIAKNKENLDNILKKIKDILKRHLIKINKGKTKIIAYNIIYTANNRYMGT